MLQLVGVVVGFEDLLDALAAFRQVGLGGVVRTGTQALINAFADALEMFEKAELDGVVIAAPTTVHLALALAAIERGLCLLVEKPLAATVDDGLAIISAARRRKVRVQVGHVERYNPAVLEINFDTDKWDIKPQYHDELKTVGDFLMYFPNAKGEISGHTDSTASDAHNQKLSERRAVAVEKYISKNFKVNPGRITTKGYGETKPIASNKTKEGRAKNRRIEAFFTCE